MPELQTIFEQRVQLPRLDQLQQVLLVQPQPRALFARVVRVRLSQLLGVQRLAPKAQLQLAVTEFGAEPLAHRVAQESTAEHGANAGAINKGLPEEA